jgi:hypothetical protein
MVKYFLAILGIGILAAPLPAIAQRTGYIPWNYVDANDGVAGLNGSAKLPIATIDTTGSTSGQVLTSNGTAPAWVTPSGGGGGSITASLPLSITSNNISVAIGTGANTVAGGPALASEIQRATNAESLLVPLNTVNTANGVAGLNGSVKLPITIIDPTGATSGQTLTFNGSGIAWVTPSGGGGGLVIGTTTGTARDAALAITAEGNALTSAQASLKITSNLSDLTNAQIALQNLQGQPPLYLGNPVYGAKCDGLTIANAAITTGTAALSSSSHTFVSGDVGKLVTVPGAGSSGGPLNATISSVSGGVATLSTNAGATVTVASATFGTNDQAAFTNVATAAAINGGLVVIPAAMCIVNGSTTVGNKVSFTGYGPGVSIVKFISTSDQSNGVFKGYTGGTACTQAISLAGWSDNHFTNFEVDQAAATQTGGYTVQSKGIDMPCATRLTFDHMYVHDSPATCLASDFSEPSIVTNNIVVNCGRSSGTGIGGNGIGQGTLNLANEGYTIANNWIINPAHYGAYLEKQSGNSAGNPAIISGNVVLAGTLAAASQGGPSAGIDSAGSDGTIITNNYVVGLATQTSWSCISIDTGTNNVASGYNTIIADNRVSSCENGIYVNYGSGIPTGGNPANVRISGNRVTNVVQFGIGIQGATASVTDGVDISDNTVSLSGSGGIVFLGAGGFSHVDIQGNRLFNNGIVGTSVAGQSGIGFSGNVAGISIVNNIAYDNAAGHQKTGLGVTSGFALTGAVISHNDFTGNATSALNIVGTISGILDHNRGFPTFTVSGSSAATPTGTGDTGQFIAGTTGTSTVTILPYGTAQITAPNGWFCAANDNTTPAALVQSASTTSSCTVTGSTTTADVVRLMAVAY